MHNRARLVVGSFLTKDLHLDWRARRGVVHALLLDGDAAQNNGNWQWIASVGVDPAPVLPAACSTRRSSSERYDPDGEYVRRWVPELRGVPAERLAEPWTMSEEEQRGGRLRRSAATTPSRSSTTRRSAAWRSSATARRAGAERAATAVGRWDPGQAGPSMAQPAG